MKDDRIAPEKMPNIHCVSPEKSDDAAGSPREDGFTEPDHRNTP
jgi:hypothetical protein